MALRRSCRAATPRPRKTARAAATTSKVLTILGAALLACATAGTAGAQTHATHTVTHAASSFEHPVYFMPFDNDPPNVSDMISTSGENQYLFAFVLDAGNCTPAWDGESSMLVSNDTTALNDINTIRAAGGDASVSFGGYNGTELGQDCSSASALAAAYQSVITKYNLDHIDLDIENTALGDSAHELQRFQAVALLEQEDPNLKVSLTIPMTTVGLPDTGKNEIQQAISAGARIDVFNLMDFDTGLTSGTEVSQSEAIAEDGESQIATLYGWDAATSWGHIGIQLMNGHSDQPSELFTQDTFSTLLSFAQSEHVAQFSFWDINRDFQCPAGAVEPWNPGNCSGITQNPYDFTKIVTQYNG